MACKGSVYALALNALGSLVIAGTAESLVRVFDSRTGAKVMKLRGHTGNVRWGALGLLPCCNDIAMHCNGKSSFSST